MNWYDPSDDSRPIISPQAEINGYLANHRHVPDFGISERVLMLQTGAEPGFSARKFSRKGGAISASLLSGQTSALCY